MVILDMLEEFKRRHAINEKRKKLFPIVKEWWWARDEALEEVSIQLRDCSHVVIDSFLGKDAFEMVHREVKLASESGLINEDGRLGGGREGMASLASVEREIRSDKIGWFDCSSLPDSSTTCTFVDAKEDIKWKGLEYLLARMETICFELRSKVEDLRNVTSRSKAMLTCYGGSSGEEDGGRYTKHVDNGNANGRRLTAIYYLNSEWKRDFGGALRLYSHIEEESSFIDVEPEADRLILFYSDKRCPHEVLPVVTDRDRFALTLWFFDAEEKRAATSKHAVV